MIINNLKKFDPVKLKFDVITHTILCKIYLEKLKVYLPIILFNI